MGNTRETACRILESVLERGSQSHQALREALGRETDMDVRDRRFVQRLVQGTLERLLLLDAKLNQVSRTPVKKMKPWIRSLLRMSTYQLLFLDNIPASAVCSQAVKLAEKRGFAGLKGFVNGVLRNIARDPSLPEGGPELFYSVPRWLLDRWEAELGPETAEAFLQASLEPGRLAVRWNLSCAAPEEFRRSLEAQTVKVEPLPYSLPGAYLEGFDRVDRLEAFEKGWLQVQNVSSILAGLAAAPAPGNRVLDLCAAPGGKSLHMADQLRGTGQVIACDLTPRKVEKIEENRRRCGFANLEARVSDARVFRPEWEGAFDRVVADLPCSGLGTIGHKPEIKYRVTPEELDSLVRLQREILSVAWRYLKPGGILLYSTCTVNRQENRDNFRWLTEHFPLEPVPLAESMPEGLREECREEGFLQLVPGKHPCDGFFISKCKRIETNV